MTKRHGLHLSQMERVDDEPCSPRGQNHAGSGAEPEAAREEFFQSDEQGERRDPEDVHDAGDEEQTHEGPAAAGAEEAVFHPHPESSARAFPPSRHDEFEGGAAVREAGVLERGELKNAGGEEQNAAEPRAAAGHGG